MPVVRKEGSFSREGGNSGVHDMSWSDRNEGWIREELVWMGRIVGDCGC